MSLKPFPSRLLKKEVMRRCRYRFLPQPEADEDQGHCGKPLKEDHTAGSAMQKAGQE